MLSKSDKALTVVPSLVSIHLVHSSTVPNNTDFLSVWHISFRSVWFHVFYFTQVCPGKFYTLRHLFVTEIPAGGNQQSCSPGGFPTTQEPPPQALLSVSPKRLQVLVQWPRIQGQSQGMWILTLSNGSSSYSWSVPRSFSFLTSTMGSNLGSDTEESDVETTPLRLKKELHPPLRWPILLPEGSEHSSKTSFPWGRVSLSSECEACKDIVESVLGEKLLFEVRRPAEKLAEKPTLDEMLR